MNCATCIYWIAKDKEHDYYGKCSFHNINRIEFNFGCKDHKANTIKPGEKLKEGKDNGKDYSNWYGLTMQEYWREVQ